MAQTNRSKEIQNARVAASKTQEVLSDSNTAPAKAVMSRSKSKKEYDMTPVKGVFRFAEVPGGTLNFYYGKYKRTGKNYSLVDGEVHTIPRCVAKHLIQTGSYPIHEFQTDINGAPQVRIGRKKRRYSFDSLEFFDDLDSRESGLVTVEKL